MRCPATRIICTALLLTGFAIEAAAQPPSSAQLAKQLVTALSAQKLEAFAVRDPETPDRAVAVLAFPDSQLLVVAAPYPDAATLDALLANRMYRDVYSALQQPSITSGKVFFQDLGCDGLQTSPESVDIMYEDGKTQTIFDGNWKKQGLTQSVYQQRAKDAETRYARLLAALVGAAQKRPL